MYRETFQRNALAIIWNPKKNCYRQNDALLWFCLAIMSNYIDIDSTGCMMAPITTNWCIASTWTPRWRALHRRGILSAWIFHREGVEQKKMDKLIFSIMIQIKINFPFLFLLLNRPHQNISRTNQCHIYICCGVITVNKSSAHTRLPLFTLFFREIE